MAYLADKRIEKAALCEWCNEPAHPTPLLCPRATSVQYGHDEVTVYFQTAPVIIALKDMPRYAQAQE
jgi:hypothetical protein